MAQSWPNWHVPFMLFPIRPSETQRRLNCSRTRSRAPPPPRSRTPPPPGPPSLSTSFISFVAVGGLSSTPPSPPAPSSRPSICSRGHPPMASGRRGGCLPRRMPASLHPSGRTTSPSPPSESFLALALSGTPPIRCFPIRVRPAGIHGRDLHAEEHERVAARLRPPCPGIRAGCIAAAAMRDHASIPFSGDAASNCREARRPSHGRRSRTEGTRARPRGGAGCHPVRSAGSTRRVGRPGVRGSADDHDRWRERRWRRWPGRREHASTRRRRHAGVSPRSGRREPWR